MVSRPWPSRRNGHCICQNLTWRSTSLPSVAGRCAIKPRSAGHLYVRHLQSMDLSPLRVVSAITSPLKWLYNLVADQTRIRVLTPSGNNWDWKSIPVHDDGTNAGILMFGVTTESQREIEITRIEVHYAAPLQLLDPGSRGFFVGAGTLDSELPFCMRWDGSIDARHDVQQAFALIARFPNRSQDHAVRFSIHARRRHSSIGGFLGWGRVRVTSIDHRIRLVSQPVLGLPVPPRCSMTTPQPFIIEGSITASTKPGEEASVVVHARDANGSVSSQNVRIPDA